MVSAIALTAFVVIVSAFMVFMCWAIVVEISIEDGEPAYIPGTVAFGGTAWIVITALPLIASFWR